MGSVCCIQNYVDAKSLNGRVNFLFSKYCGQRMDNYGCLFFASFNISEN